MTAEHDLDPALRSYLQAQASGSVPANLREDVLDGVRTTGQRPAWTIPGRWMSPRVSDRLAPPVRAAVTIGTLVIVSLILVAVVVIVGSQRRLPPPFGLAKPGLIALVSDGHLYTVHGDGTGRRQLTFGERKDDRPTWSPDGMRIAYLSTAGSCVPASCLSEPTALMVISPDGGNPVTVASGLSATSVGEITWSPDSRRLAYAAVKANALLSLSHVFVTEADGSGQRQVGDPSFAGFEPAWSPDASWIAFMRTLPKQGLWLIRPDGTDAHPLTTVAGSGWAFWSAQWSPDSAHLAFLAGDDLAHTVWVIDSDGSHERQLISRPASAWWPTWSPDGSRIAYVEQVGSLLRGQFVVVNRDGSDPRVLNGPAIDGSMPVWAPDGTKLFGFLSGTADCTPCQYSLHHTIHQGVAVYDATGMTPPLILAGAEDGTWQRLAP